MEFKFHIIPKIFKTNKLMTLYSIKPNRKNTVLVVIILVKYLVTNSLIKIFSYLNAIYNFNPYRITTDLDYAKIKALKNCKNLLINHRQLFARFIKAKYKKNEKILYNKKNS